MDLWRKATIENGDATLYRAVYACKSDTKASDDHGKRDQAAPIPTNELRQLIVTPITSTMVNASTNSTAEARKAAANIVQNGTILLSSSLEVEGELGVNKRRIPRPPDSDQ